METFISKTWLSVPLDLSNHFINKQEELTDFVTVFYESDRLGGFSIDQYDTTDTFYRDAGDIIIRAQGDCYYFPEGSYDIQMDHNEEYNALTERYKNFQIDPRYWDEVLALSKERDSLAPKKREFPWSLLPF